MSATDEFQIFLRELQRINDAKQLNPKTGNNGAASIHTPQAVDVNHTQIVPQQVHTPDILKKSEPQNESRVEKTESNSTSFGWIKIHRTLLDHWIYEHTKPFSFKEAWLDILLNVNYKENKVSIGFTIFNCEPGQSLYSMNTWAERWGWSQSRVRRFLKLLEKDKMVEFENVKKSTRITVINWESYQSEQISSESQVNRKRKQDKNEKKKEYTTAFEEFQQVERWRVDL